jgi:SAM-dependent methyltransferase
MDRQAQSGEGGPTPNAADAALDLYAQGGLALSLAGMHAVLATADADDLAAALDRARARHGAATIAPLAAALDAGAQARVRSVASELDHTYRAAPDEVLARLAAGFDRAAALSPEAGVALYSLGDAARLAEVTAEVVSWLRAERLVHDGDRLLEVGCGAGRFLLALAAQTHFALGVEISGGMALEAARRLRPVASAAVVRSSGRDLAFVAGGAFDLVLYADSFPYLVQAGGDLPKRMLMETARVLRPGGRAVVLNWSYRGDLDLDRQEAGALAGAAGLERLACPQPGFKGWDATATVLSKPGDLT